MRAKDALFSIKLEGNPLACKRIPAGGDGHQVSHRNGAGADFAPAHRGQARHKSAGQNDQNHDDNQHLNKGEGAWAWVGRAACQSFFPLTMSLLSPSPPG